LSKVAVLSAVALCEHTKSPVVALAVIVRVFETTKVQFTPSADR
jgi:hypothetical protein